MAEKGQRGGAQAAPEAAPANGEAEAGGAGGAAAPNGEAAGPEPLETPRTPPAGGGGGGSAMPQKEDEKKRSPDRALAKRDDGKYVYRDATGAAREWDEDAQTWRGLEGADDWQGPPPDELQKQITSRPKKVIDV